MATKLATEQRDDLNQHGNKPVPVIDPVTNAVYFLVSSDIFDRLRDIFGDEAADIREAYAVTQVDAMLSLAASRANIPDALKSAARLQRAACDHLVFGNS